MKRFIVLGLVLLVLGMMRCETIAKQEERKKAVAPKAKELPSIKFSLADLMKLRNKLRAFQGKVVEVKKKILTIPPAKRAPLIKEKLEYKHQCAMITKEIMTLKIKLEKLYTDYYEECMKKAISEKNVVEKKMTTVEFKLKQIREKIVETCECIKVAPKADIQELKEKEAVAKLNEKKLVKLLKVISAKYRQAIEKVKTVIEKKANHEIKVKKKELIKLNKKFEWTREKVITLSFKIQDNSKALRNLKRTTPEERQRAQVLKQKISEDKKQHAEMSAIEKNLKKKAKILISAIAKTKKYLIKAKKATECKELDKQLTKELENAKELHQVFVAKVKEAEKTKRMQAIKDADKLRKEIEKAKIKSQKIKDKLLHKGSNVEDLEKKKKIYDSIISKKEKKLKKLEKLITKVVNEFAKATTQEKHDLEKEKSKLAKKILVLKKDIINYQKKAILVKVSAAKKCNEAVNKEKIESKKLMFEAEDKLKLAKKEANKLIKSLALIQNASTLEEKLRRLKVENLMTQGGHLTKELARKEGEIEAKIQELKELAELQKKKAESIRKMLELRSKRELEKAMKKARKEEEKYNNKISEVVEKINAIEGAAAKNTDAAVKDALKEELTIEKKRLNLYQEKYQSVQAAIKSIQAEMELQKKVLEAIRKEAALKALLLEKQFKERAAKMKIEFDAKKGKRLALKMKKERGVGNKEISKMNEQIKSIKGSFEAYKKQLKKSHNEKAKELLHKQTNKFNKKIKKLLVEIEQQKVSHRQWKRKYYAETDERLKTIADDHKLKLKDKINGLKENIRQAIFEGKAKIEAIKKLIAEKLYVKQEETRKRMDKLTSDRADLKLRLLEKTTSLKKKIETQTKTGKKLKEQIGAEKEKQTARMAELKSWEATKTKELKMNLLAKKKYVAGQVKKIELKIKKTQVASLKASALLSTKIKNAKAEIKKFELMIMTEKSRYMALVKKSHHYKITSKKELARMVTVERLKRETLAKKVSKELIKCNKQALQTKKKVEKLNEEMTALFAKISKWTHTEKKITDGKKKIVDFQEKLMELRLRFKKSQNKYDKLCDDDLEKEGEKCVNIKNTLVSTDVEITEAVKKLEDAKKIILTS